MVNTIIYDKLKISRMLYILEGINTKKGWIASERSPSDPGENRTKHSKEDKIVEWQKKCQL